MQTRIREVRKAKGLTLAEVAARCSPPTTAQTIGRLETGTRTVSVGWLNRIAAALGVDPSELVSLPDRPDVPVAAILGPAGAESPRRPMMLAAPSVQADLIGMTVEVAQGEYRAGDEIWLTRVAPAAFALGLNKDVLVPLPEGGLESASTRGLAGSPVRTTPSAGGNPETSSGPTSSGPTSSGTRPGSRFVFGRLVAVGTGLDGTGAGSFHSDGSNSGTTSGTIAQPPSAQPSSMQTPSAQALQILPLTWGAQPVIVPAPEWIAVVSVLMRKL